MTKKIHLNTATQDELRQVEGIGNRMADATVRYRDEHGKFQNKDQIEDDPGFSEIRTSKLKKAVDL